MDEVLEKLALISPSDETGQNHFESLYKNWGKLKNQEERRKTLLQVQKVNRNQSMDNYRGVIELVQAVEGSNIFQDSRPLYRPNIFVAGFTKCTYSNVLMMSEWMIEKPEDFHENWFVVPCPKGVRTLVVASQGTTKCFSKYGHFRLECRTALPGGNPNSPKNGSKCCVLDCFHVEATNTMYILDLLGWNSQPMGDGEAQFRHFWLQMQIDEIPELKKLSKTNKLIFKMLPKVSCDRDSFNQFMMKYPHFENVVPKMDGLLFYHKLAHYFAGQTPLVGWLYPFMVPEVIGPDVTVNPAFMMEMPQNYVNQADYIQKFEEKPTYAKRRQRRSESMDTTPWRPIPPAPVEVVNKTSEMLSEEMEADVPKDATETNNEKNTENMEADLPKHSSGTKIGEKSENIAADLTKGTNIETKIEENVEKIQANLLKNSSETKSEEKME